MAELDEGGPVLVLDFFGKDGLEDAGVFFVHGEAVDFGEGDVDGVAVDDLF